MPMYLESLSEDRSWLAEIYCNKTDLQDGRVYSLDELGFNDWLNPQGRPVPNKLKAVLYGHA